MAGQNLFHRAGGQAVAGHIDHVIGARHDIEIAVLVQIAGIAGLVIAGEMRQIGLSEPVLGIPQCRQRAGWQRQFQRNRAQRAGGDRLAAFVQDLHVISRHGDGRAAGLDRQPFDPQGVGRNGPSGFGLPPMIDHRHGQVIFGPFDGIGIGAFACQKQRLEAGQVIVADQLALGILALDGADRGGRGEEGLDPMILDHSPEDAGIGGADGLALEHDGGRARDQRTIADIAVAHDPADIRCGPEHISGLDRVDVVHRPLQRDQMTRRMAHHALGLTRRARGIKDIDRVMTLDRHAIGGRGVARDPVPVEIAIRDQFGRLLFALQDDAGIGLVRSLIDGPVQKRLVGDDAPRLQPAGRGYDSAGPGVVDAHGQFMRREAAEDDRMDRPQPRAGQHRLQRLGNHGHVDDDAVAFPDASGAQRACKAGHAVAKLGIGDALDAVGDGAVMDDGKAVAVAGLDMTIHGVPAGIDHRFREPFARRAIIGIGAAGRAVPVDRLRRAHPEPLRIGFPARIDVLVGHDVLLLPGTCYGAARRLCNHVSGIPGGTVQESGVNCAGCGCGGRIVAGRTSARLSFNALRARHRRQPRPFDLGLPARRCRARLWGRDR